MGCVMVSNGKMGQCFRSRSPVAEGGHAERQAEGSFPMSESESESQLSV